ncbi:hypothetical protein ACFFRR_008847 [Megaselia abdita]
MPKLQHYCENNCGKWYPTRHGMLRHLRSDCGKEKQFQCKICLKFFKRKYHLKRHYQTHCVNYEDLEYEEKHRSVTPDSHDGHSLNNITIKKEPYDDDTSSYDNGQLNTDKDMEPAALKILNVESLNALVKL